ncbi:MAG: DUF1640 domain-containing protein [Gammaproteobacteria bacterium]|nr:DUF1640 domain-containing protein [Gammaproteobacteria bacterium]MDE0410957.1 DUF1640 domain-containing protein [Gammaproteobacteria bacterium]
MFTWLRYFDTHAAVKSLIATGFKEKQAEATTATTRELAESGLATKANLYEVTLGIVALNAAMTGFLLKVLIS